MADFVLEAVKCKNCGSGLMVEVNDNITYCTNCGSGFEIEEGVLNPIEINFASPAIRSEGEIIYKPFWFITASIAVLERTADGGFLKSIFNKTDGSGNAQIKFYIPGFYLPVNKMKQIALAFTAANPVASPQKYNSPLVGFTYSKNDAKKFCEFVLISMEAEKSDTMKTFKYNIDYNEISILGMPFYKHSNGSLKDAVLGMDV
ncbi:hypothetical protein BH10BAC5_BH10BAC5_08980 [soil metagenome]